MKTLLDKILNQIAAQQIRIDDSDTYQALYTVGLGHYPGFAGEPDSAVMTPKVG